MEAVKFKIKVNRTTKSRLPEVDFDRLPFGRIFSDHMLVADFRDGRWHDPEILPYGKLELYPAINAIQYGISIFEGMKAYKTVRGETALFRPRDNWRRLNRSAQRLVMVELPEEIFLEGLKELLRVDAGWVPRRDGSSLYVRPCLFAVDEFIGIKPAERYKFVIFTCPVGAYYAEPVNLWVTKEYVRAFEGGTGEAKAAGNYAASLLGAQKAQEIGYHNVLWLDGKEHRYIEECGTMNVFFVIDDVVVTPKLDGTILAGITRASAITLLRDEGIPVEERRISLDELIEAHRADRLKECFGAGTAVTIADVAKIGIEGEDLVLPRERRIAPMLLEKLTNIRTGRVADPYGWIVTV